MRKTSMLHEGLSIKCMHGSPSLDHFRGSDIQDVFRGAIQDFIFYK